MIRIFIIDDETPIRQWIRFCIERSDSAFEVIGDSPNGEDGISALESMNADIVILDIMMPGVNGLEIIPKLRQIQPEIFIIMLTNFAEFEYIQKAVRNGATEYFLKSEITEEKLMNCLYKIADKMKKNSILKTLSAESEIKTVHRLCERILNESITSRQQYLEAASSFPAPLSFTNNLFVIAIEHPHREAPIFSEEQMEDISEYLSTMHLVCHRSRITLMICEMSKLHSRLIMFNAIADIIKWIGSHLDFLYIGISNIYTDFSYFYNAVNEALLSMHSGFYKSPGTVTYIWHTSDSTLDQNVLSAYSKTIVHIAKLKSYNELILEISLVFNYFRKTMPPDPEFVTDYFLELAYLIRSVYMSNTQNFQLPDKDMNLHIRKIFQNCVSLDELEAAVKQVLQSFCSNTETPGFSSSVEKAIEYIREHYCDNISLRDVAQYVHMNADYLGKLFKKETGISFNAYLTNIKMEYADYLIRNTNLRKYEIAEKLGYTNFSYFSRIYSSYKAKQHNHKKD